MRYMFGQVPELPACDGAVPDGAVVEGVVVVVVEGVVDVAAGVVLDPGRAGRRVGDGDHPAGERPGTGERCEQLSGACPHA